MTLIITHYAGLIKFLIDYFKVSQRAPDPRRKRHLQISKDLPLPKLSDKPIEDIKAFVEGISRSKAENEKTTVNSEISEKIAKVI